MINQCWSTLLSFLPTQPVQPMHRPIRSIPAAVIAGIFYTNIYLKIKVFGFIHLFFRTIQDIKQLQGLMKHLLINVRELVMIDAEKMSLILDSYPESDFKEAISRLNEFPQLKYSLLQKIVIKKRNNKETLEDKLMVDYFELTCKLNPERVSIKTPFRGSRGAQARWFSSRLVPTNMQEI